MQKQWGWGSGSGWEWGLLLIYLVLLLWRSTRLIKSLRKVIDRSKFRGSLQLGSQEIRSTYFVGLGWVLLIAYFVRQCTDVS